MFQLRRSSILLVLALTAAPAAWAELQATGEPPAARQGWKAETVAQGVRQPWGIAWLGEGRALVTSKQGTLHLLNGNKFEEVALEGMPTVFTGGQGGLLDIVLHPQDAGKANPRVYMTVSTGMSDANRTTLVRGVFDGKKVTGIETLFKVSTDKSGGQHFGSRLLWLPDATLLMSVADGGNPPLRIGDRLAREQAQNLATHQGSILRLTQDGKPAPGNPLAAKGALPEIWSYGHRNVQGLALDPVSGRVWATEHGPYGGDELNLVVAGGNYGWPLQSYGADYKTHEPVGKHEVAGMLNPERGLGAVAGAVGAGRLHGRQDRRLARQHLQRRPGGQGYPPHRRRCQRQGDGAGPPGHRRARARRAPGTGWLPVRADG